MAEIVDDPKIPENQVPKDQSDCSLFQKDTGVAEIVDDPKVPETQVPRNRKFLFEIGITNSVLFLILYSTSARGTVRLRFIPGGYCCGRDC